MTEKEELNSNYYFKFHPFEIAFCGYSGSGKTTLITKLLNHFSNKYKIAYLKHDAHKFEMDKEGKDTYKCFNSGASQVFISDSNHHAFIGEGQLSTYDYKYLFLENDFTFIEGWKNNKINKIIFIDEHNEIVDQILKDKFSNVIAFIGKNEECNFDNNKIPYFCRNDVENISTFVMSFFLKKVNRTSINGLILTGGKSRRMGKDKALINRNESSINSQNQTQWMYELLKKHCDNVFISSQNNQWDNVSSLKSLPKIHDKFINIGPLGGILSAFKEYPNSALLVSACDLFCLDELTLIDLISMRNPFKFATVYQGVDDGHKGLPEPLFGIYEPKIYRKLFDFLSQGILCPRKILLNLPIEKINLKNETALSNINTQSELKKHNF